MQNKSVRNLISPMLISWVSQINAELLRLVLRVLCSCGHACATPAHDNLAAFINHHHPSFMNFVSGPRNRLRKAPPLPFKRN